MLVGPIAIPNSETASIVAREMSFHHNVDEPLFAPQTTFMAKEGEVILHFFKRDDIVFIRPDLIQCEHGQCDYIRNGMSFFADDNHIAEGALPMFRPAFEPGAVHSSVFVLLSGSRSPAFRDTTPLGGTNRLRCWYRFTSAKAAQSHWWFFQKPR